MKRIFVFITLLVGLFFIAGCSCTNKQLKIDFVTNGGEAIPSKNVDSGFVFETEPEATRVGYTFAGWFYDKDLTESLDLSRPIIRHTTLYAKWSINSYTMKFMIGPNLFKEITANYGSRVILDDPYEEGYTFGGWYQDEALTTAYSVSSMPGENLTVYGKLIANKYKVEFLDPEGDLYAQEENVLYGTELNFPVVAINEGDIIYWTKYGEEEVVTSVGEVTSNLKFQYHIVTKTYNVIFLDSEGGNEIYNEVIPYNGQVIAPEMPEKEGYDPIGWFEVNGKIYDLNHIRDNFVFYPKYSIKKYTVTIDFKSEQQVETRTVNHGSPIGAITVLDKVGHNFKGWFLGNGTEVFENTIVTSNMTINASWEKKSFELTLQANGGKFEGDLDQLVIDVEYGDKLADVIQMPVRSGYSCTFVYENEEEVSLDTLIEDNLTIKAKWLANSYKIYFEVDGAPFGEAKDVTYGLPVNDSGILEVTSKTGHTFIGWFYNEQEIKNETVYLYLEDITVSARFTVNKYKITFDSNGGTPVESIYQDYGTEITTPTNPTKTGYSFASWDQVIPNTMPANNMTIKASWNINSYTITLHLNGGTVENTLLTFEYNSIISLPLPSKDGVSFVGWFTDDNTFLNEFTQTKMPANNLDLYADYSIWPVITLKLNGGTLSTTLISQEPGTAITSLEPTKTGYAFNGWNPALPTVMPDTSIEVEATWVPVEVDYNVEYYLENENGEYIYTPNLDQVNQALTESTVTLSVTDLRTIEHYQFKEHENNLLTGVVLGDGSLTLKVYFERVSYELTVVNTNYINDPNYLPTPHALKWGDKMSMLIRIDYVGKAYVGYQDADGNEYTNNSLMPQNDLTVYLQYNNQNINLRYKVVRLEKEIINYVAGDTPLEVSRTMVTKERYQYGTYVKPYQAIPGYRFVKMINNGVEYLDSNQTFAIEDIINLEIYYERIVVTINFMGFENGDLSGNMISFGSYAIFYGQSLAFTENGGDNTLPWPEIVVQPGYIATWERTNFSFLRENGTIYARYINTSKTLLTFVVNGSTIAVFDKADYGEDGLLFEASSPLWHLQAPGYVFEYWYYLDQGLEVPITDPNDMKFSVLHTGTGEKKIFAKFRALTPFTKPVIISVQKLPGEEIIQIKINLNPSQIDGNLPLGFGLFINHLYEEVLISDFSISGFEFTLEVSSLDSFFSELIAIGTNRLTVRALGDNLNTLNSPYSDAYIIEVDADITPASSMAYDHYILEDVTILGAPSQRYILYENMTYNFPEGYEINIVQNADIVSLSFKEGTNAPVIKTNLGLIGDFQMTIKKPGEDVAKLYLAKIVKDFSQFSLGEAYTKFKYETNSLSPDRKYLKPLTGTEKFLVGSGNDFKFTYAIKDTNLNNVSLEKLELEYLFYLDGASTPLEEGSALEHYLAEVTGKKNVFKFTNNAVGHDFKVIVKPKYQANEHTWSSLEYNIHVNNGYNAYTSSELKTLFGNMSVQTINIQNNIEVQLLPNQVNPDGSPINYHRGAVTGDPYRRVSYNTSGDNIVINGNYLTINGSNLPHMSAAYSSYLPLSTGFPVFGVGLSIFKYDVYNSSPEHYFVKEMFKDKLINGHEILSDGSRYNPSAAVHYNDNMMTINNLTINSNTSYPYIDYNLSPEEIESQEAQMTQNSGSYNGIYAMEGAASVNNVNITNALIALYNDASGLKTNDASAEQVLMKVDYVQADDSWANSVYMHGGTGITITNSKIGKSGGAAIHIEDAHPEVGEIFDVHVTVDANTTINNWVNGNEAWFNAYAMSTMVAAMKSTIEGHVSGAGRSILKKEQDQLTGQMSEKMNLIILAPSVNHAFLKLEDNTTVSSAQYSIHIGQEGLDTGTQARHRTYDPNLVPTNYQDPRDPSGNAGFLYPAIATYSPPEGFLDLVTYLMSNGVPQANAGQLAMLAGFYNLTKQETLQIAGGATLESILAANPRVIPKYLEVVTKIALFPGDYTYAYLELVDPS